MWVTLTMMTLPRASSTWVTVTRMTLTWMTLTSRLPPGYYRVLYDEMNWELLLAAMVTQHDTLPTATRAQIFGDVLALAQAGHLEWVRPIQFLESLTRERDSSVWITASEVIGTLVDHLAHTEAYTLFKVQLGAPRHPPNPPSVQFNCCFLFVAMFAPSRRIKVIAAQRPRRSCWKLKVSAQRSAGYCRVSS